MKYNSAVINAAKASPAGMFPAVAAKSGITMGSKLGQAITKSPTGKLPAQMKRQVKAGGKLISSALRSALGGAKKR